MDSYKIHPLSATLTTSVQEKYNSLYGIWCFFLPHMVRHCIYSVSELIKPLNSIKKNLCCRKYSDMVLKKHIGQCYPIYLKIYEIMDISKQLFNDTLPEKDINISIYRYVLYAPATLTDYETNEFDLRRRSKK